MTNPLSNQPGRSIEPWQLTAYALNELDEEDTKRVQQMLEGDASLRTEFEQIQKTLSAVRLALAETPPGLQLSKVQTAAVVNGIEQVVARRPELTATKFPLTDRPFYRRKRFAALLATAAAIPIAATWLPAWFADDGLVVVSTRKLNEPRDLNDDLAHKSLASGPATLSALTHRLNPTEAKEIDIQVLPEAGSGEISNVDTTPVPEMGLVIVKGNKEEVERAGQVVKNVEGTRSLRELDETTRLMTTVTPRILFPEEVKELEEPQRDLLSKNTLTDRLGMGGGGMGGEKSAPVAAKPTADSLGEMPGSMNDDSDSTFAAIPLGRAGAESQLQQFPEELRQNVPAELMGERYRRRENESTRDRFEKIVESPFLQTQRAPLSTFSIDVDTASYSKVRQTLMEANRLPNPNMVRIEEMLNYFEYAYPGPSDNTPFAAQMIVDKCPWNPEHQLVRIGLQARKLDMDKRAKANIVFLLDVSGSMNEPNKLPLVKKSLTMLTSQLTENDRVAIVVYAGAAGCVLPSTNGANKQAILSSLEHLNAGGSTNGGQGIQLAYSIAKEQFIPGGVNRVILCTDGDFNVGVTGDNELVAMMQENAKSNVFLTCLGFGAGNFNDQMMEKISGKGNGLYGMVDNELEARRMMIEQLAGTLVTVAKDVKIQVDFNPTRVAGYRLIGYENRKLANQDFNNDQKDAGEIGAGHRVTALYEVIPVGKSFEAIPTADGEASKYLPRPKSDSKVESTAPASDFPTEWLTLKVRYKEPEGSVSTKQEFVLRDSDKNDRPFLDRDMQWATSVAEFGLLLRRSEMAPNADWSRMLERASTSAGGDAYRVECLDMMRRAAQLNGIDGR